MLRLPRRGEVGVTEETTAFADAVIGYIVAHG
jgi:hypothetical protein